MDATYFEALLRSFSRAPSRRAALRTTLGVLSLAASWLSVAPATLAKKKRKKKRRTRRCERPAPPPAPPPGPPPVPPGSVCCTEGQTVCDGDCADLATNPNHCGRCGSGCQLNANCSDGACVCVSGPCSVPGATCCPKGAAICVCQAPGAGFVRADTCEIVATCPDDMTPCEGTSCAACCPAGTQCNETTGTCVR